MGSRRSKEFKLLSLVALHFERQQGKEMAFLPAIFSPFLSGLFPHVINDHLRQYMQSMGYWSDDNAVYLSDVGISKDFKRNFTDARKVIYKLLQTPSLLSNMCI